MPRPKRMLLPGELYHVTIRGNNRQPIFFDESDHLEYLHLLREIIQRYATKLHAFVLMPNHTHLLVQPTQKDTFSTGLQTLHSTHAKYINRRYTRSGHLFQGRFHSKHVARDSYLLVASRYIHNNPVRAGMVHDPCLYPWSSVRVYTGELDRGSSRDRLIGRLTETTLILSLFGEGLLDRETLYREFVKSVPGTKKVLQRNRVPDTG